MKEFTTQSEAGMSGSFAFHTDEAANMFGFSPAEIQVSYLHAMGMEREEIASKLGVSPNTVKRHVWHINLKLKDRGFDVPNRTAMTLLFVQKRHTYP